MRLNLTVAAKLRAVRGKNEARRLRASGLIPAVVYGSGKDALAISVDPRKVTRILHSGSGHNTIFDLSVDGGETTPVMIVDWQLDPVKDALLHVDLKRIDLTRRLKVSVPVYVYGEPKGVKEQGGLLEIVTREIEVECLPDDIPEHFTVDVSDLLIGQSRRASEVPMSESTRLLTSADAVIAHVVALRAHEEAHVAEVAATGAEGEAAPPEPEVIKKGKKEAEE